MRCIDFFVLGLEIWFWQDKVLVNFSRVILVLGVELPNPGVLHTDDRLGSQRVYLSLLFIQSPATFHLNLSTGSQAKHQMAILNSHFFRDSVNKQFFLVEDSPLKAMKRENIISLRREF